MILAKMPDGTPEVFRAVQGEGLTMGLPVIFIRMSSCNLACNFCWVAGTNILMADGTQKPIEKIKVGDLVMSYQDRGYTISMVNEVIKRQVAEITTFEAGEIKTIVTPDHKYYTNHHKSRGKMLCEAKDLLGKYVKRTHYALVDKPEETLEYRLGYLKGALIGDGCVSLQQDKYLRMFFQVTDYDFIEKIADIGNNDLGFNGRITESKRRTKRDKIVYRYSVGKKEQIKMLLELPKSKEEERGYIAGFFDAEGHVGRNQLTLSQKDLKVLNRVGNMLLNFGFNFYLKEREVSVITINGREQVVKFMLLFQPAIIRKYEKIFDDKNKQMKAVKVDTVNTIKKKTTVYNITTTVGNCFANGLLATQCDTAYTWLFDDMPKAPEHRYFKPVKREDYQMILDPIDVARRVLEINKGIKAIVFSGGEPTIQQKAICEVIDHILQLTGDSREDWHFEMETNGTLPVSKDLEQRLDQINCSPKLASSGNTLQARERTPAIARLREIYLSEDNYVDLCFKFVMHMEKWEDDLAEIQAWQERHNIPNKAIYLMPEGITRERILEATKVVEEVAQKYQYKVSTRLHVLIHGQKRAT